MNIFQKVRKEADRPLLTYSFAGKGSDSLYEYLYKCIKNDILSRDLAAGTRLPSKRGFAKNLGISVITVENAYAQLQAEGYIYSLPKKGYYVNAIPAGDGVLPPGLATAAHRDEPEENAVRDDLVSPPTRPDLFPFSIWTRLTRDVLGDGYDDLLRPSPSGGVMTLRAAIAEYLRQFRDMRVAPEQIVVGAGTEYLYGLIVQLLGFDRVYAVENPGYKKLAQIYRSHRVACRYVAMDREGVSVPALEASGADVLHISPGHHFPTGIMTPVGRRYELLGWAAREDSRFIIEDDFDSEFRMTGRPIPMLQTIDVSEKVIYMNTFSKSRPPPSASATWSCRPGWRRGFTRTWPFTAAPCPPSSRPSWRVSSRRDILRSTSAGPGITTKMCATSCCGSLKRALCPPGLPSPGRTQDSIFCCTWIRFFPMKKSAKRPGGSRSG